MAEQQATAAVIEIIERGKTTDETLGGSVIMPNGVLINGQPVLVPADATICIHEIRSDEMVAVTLTLLARRISVRAEGDQP